MHLTFTAAPAEANRRSAMISPRNFVDTVPEALAQLLRKTPEVIPDKYKELVLRLLTDARMDPAWKKLSVLGFKDAEGKSSHPVHFLVEVTNLYDEWDRVPKRTALHLEEEAQDLLKDIRELAQRIKESKFDISAETPVLKARQVWLEKQGYVYDDTQLAMVHPEVEGFSIPIYSTWFFDEPTISDMLAQCADVVEHFDYGRESLIRQPNSESERNRYFCRRLSAYFKRRYDKPFHELTATIHNSLFDNREFDADAVQRLVSS